MPAEKAGDLVRCRACGAARMAPFPAVPATGHRGEPGVSPPRAHPAPGTVIPVEAPQPVGVPEWLIYGALGLSALFGAAASYGNVAEKVASQPFCERCKQYMGRTTLWSVPPGHALRAVAAFEPLDPEAIGHLPWCRGFKNRVAVDLWSCPNGHRHFLELVGHAVGPTAEDGREPAPRDPVRIFSRTLAQDQVELVRHHGASPPPGRRSAPGTPWRRHRSAVKETQ